MNTAQQRRLQKLEERHHDQITIRVGYNEVAFPEVIVRFVVAKPESPDEPPPSESL
jgi:hypothetical protein